MHIQDVVFYIFAAVSTLYVIHFGMYLIGANLYDIWNARLKIKYSPKQTGNKLNPLVSVLIPAHNEEKVIIRCLDSVRNSTYKRLEIIVVDDASTDATFKLVCNYLRQHPGESLSVLRKRKNVGKGAALTSALRQRAKGELVMTIDADSILMPEAVSNAVAYFADPRVVGVAANVRIIDEPTILGVLQKLEHMISYRAKKIYSLTNCEYVIGGVASTYRMDVLREVGFYDTDTVTEDIGLSLKIANRGNRIYRLVYGSDVAAMTEGVASLSALLKQRYRWKYGSMQNLIKYRHLVHSTDLRYSLSLTWYRVPMAFFSEITLLFAPIVWIYTIYLTLSTHDPRLFLGAYLTITAYMLLTLWSDEHTKFLHRIRLSLYAPIAYFIFYIMDAVQFIAATRCLNRIHRLIHQEQVGSTWVSPQRIGREVITG